MNFGKLPVQPKEADPPVLAVNRWRIVDNKLVKTYEFMRMEDKKRFVNCMLDYELKTQHTVFFVIDDRKVTLEINTKDVDRVTELDKEAAKYADVAYRDVVYSDVLR